MKFSHFHNIKTPCLIPRVSIFPNHQPQRSMYTLSKSERLCSQILMGELLASGLSFIKYPFRIVYKISSQTGDYPARIAISVSKKKFKRAVKRNRVKRLVRENFRLHKEILYAPMPSACTIDILFIYLDDKLPAFSKVEKAITAALQKIANDLSSPTKTE